HWQLQSEGRAHRWLHRQFAGHPSIQRIWRGLSSPRSGRTDFPLPSLALLLISLLLFILLTLALMETRVIWEWNQATHNFFQNLRQPLFDPTFIVVTLLGDAEAHY